MAAITTLLWDNDGVLVDTEHLYFASNTAVLAEHGVRLDAETYAEYFLRQNRGLRHFASELAWSKEEFERVRRDRGARYAQLLREESRVCEGVEAVLESLASDYRMAIVTSSLREHFDIIHEQSGLLGYFEFVLASGDYERSKPHPDPYLKAVERAGVTAAECLVIEDSPRGVRAAKAAGLRCVAIPSRLTSGHEFPGADHVLDHVRHLPALIRSGPASTAE